MEKERKFSMYTGCKTYGSNKWSSTSMRTCSDPECSPCRNMSKILQKELESLISEVEEGITGNVLTDEKFKKYTIPYKRFSSGKIREAVEHVFNRNKIK